MAYSPAPGRFQKPFHQGRISFQMSYTVKHFASHLHDGCGNAAQRLHLALCRSGVESKLCFNTGEPLDDTMIPAFQNRRFFWRNMEAGANLLQRRREAKGGVSVSPRWVRRTHIQACGDMPSVVNLHWMLKWIDLPSFFNSLPPGLPVVWSIHDLIPITGGCPQTMGCERFTQECGNCPQLKAPHPHDASHKYFQIKQNIFRRANLHFVGNSEWTTSQIRRSALGKVAKSITTIHLGIDPQMFRPVPKLTAKAALGISGDKFVIGFACLNLDDEGKGGRLLVEALRSFEPKNIVFLLLGSGKVPLALSGIETISLGSLGTSRLQCIFYSALDVLAMPSRVETFGLVALEAMACETPVVAFSAGGLTDVVADGETGLMEPEIGSVAGLVRMLHWMWDQPAERVAMGIAARQRAIAKFSDRLMARRYRDLYNDLM